MPLWQKRGWAFMSKLVDMADQFGGLPMEALIGAPLQAAGKSQLMLAGSTVNFIKEIGFESSSDGNNVSTRMVDFSFTRPNQDDKGNPITEKVEMSVPLLSIVSIPNLLIDDVDVTFDMEVKSSESSTQKNDQEASLDAKAKFGWGLFSLDVSVQGKVSAHEENTRASDNAAKYHVKVHASQAGMPEGLARVLDIMATASAPRSITPDKEVTATTTTTTTTTTTNSPAPAQNPSRSAVA
jgi:hypothetical protein